MPATQPILQQCQSTEGTDYVLCNLFNLPCGVGDVSKDVDFEELARCTDDFNGAQCKAVCVEAVSASLLTYMLI